MLAGLAWTGGAKWATQLFSWVTTVLVARLLTREDYGVTAMATVVLGFVQLINEFGIGAAIVQRRDLDEDQIAKIGGFSVALGLGFCAAGVLLSWPVAAFFGESATGPVMAALSLNFIASSVRTVPYALLTRNLQFRRLALIETAEGLCLTVFTLVLALLGFGYWSLVIGSVAAKFLGSLFAQLAQPHRIAWPRPFAPIAAAIRFGVDVVLARIAWYIYANADFAVVGRLLGTAALGAYSFGWTLASIPVDKIYQLYQRVTGAVFAKVQDDRDAVRRYLLGLTEGISLVSFPLSVGMALVAGDFVMLVLGSEWLPAVAPLRLLSLASAIRSLDPLLAQLLVSTGHARSNARTMITAAFIMPVAFIAGSRWGPAGVAAAWLIGHPLLVMSRQLREALRISGTPVLAYGMALWPATSGTAMMTIAVVLAGRALESSALPLRFSGSVAAGVAAYLATALLLHRDRIRAMRALLATRR